MKKEITFNKGDECYEVASVMDNEISEMLNKEFEDTNAELKSKTKITVIIDVLYTEEVKTQ